MGAREYLVVLEVSQKQNYIFKTDRLVENIGASIIIRKVTEELPQKYTSPEEFVFEGGGKSVYAFESEEKAKEFIKKMSREVLEKYPGLELFMAVKDYDVDNDLVIEAINSLYGELEKKKSSRAHSFRTIGFGITETCVDTGLPAADKEQYEDNSILVSSEAKVKIKEGKTGQDMAFSELLPEQKGYKFARKFEDLGGSRGSKNYISVIVIDGNKMGKKIEKFRNDFKVANPNISAETNKMYKEELKALSEEIDGHYREAVKVTIQKITDNLDRLNEKGVVAHNHDEDGAIFLPIRPLIMAGDDICLVTDSRIGVDVAETVLLELEHKTVLDIPMRACAGIAMVRTGYPFFRAHELAEELCHNAKSILPYDDSKDASVMDFHMDQGELAGSLSTIRRELYNNSSLTSKPYYIKAEDSDGGLNNMDSFRKRLDIFKAKDMGRGFVKQYRDALFDGEDAARKYLADKRKNDIGEGYVNGHCIDFDVIEMIDVYNRLEEE